ncbi:hypothetical protein TcBrA4_0040430 [Trypanosoma cruzi]|nr:hypothetical protein TcBrA4_0040430 [Trypanosoma cruzi]
MGDDAVLRKGDVGCCAALSLGVPRALSAVGGLECIHSCTAAQWYRHWSLMGCCGPQASVCASTSASLAVARRAELHIQFLRRRALCREGGRHADDAIMLFPAAGLMVACASSVRATRAGPATRPVAPHGQEWTHRRHDSCEQSRGAAPRQAKGGGFRVGDVNIPPITQNNTSSPTQLRAQRQTFRQSEAGGVPPQRGKPPQARRPPASPPVVCFPSALAAPTLCSFLQENTSRGKKDSCVANKQGTVCHWRCPAHSAHRRRGRVSRHALFTHREPHRRH